ncbi:glycosyltransferase family 2 protein [Pedobacter sp. ASV1-7]|uniref:glycosyltransferase family 2 protein n=1 Tax=Pedobacter sp. ASV1-7 TaxID=3145237 RepID=UPI0032E891F6
MKISIITVVYNNVTTIEEAIKSVLSQNCSDIEYIIIDGKSNDGTLELIHKYKEKIHKIISEKDNGIYDAMNKGIQCATGDIIGILNSDDLYADDNVLKDVKRYFDEDPKLDILYGDLVYVKSDDIDKVVRNWKSSSYYSNYFERGNVPPHPSLFLKACVYKKAGLFDVKYKLAADYEFMLRIFKKYNFNSKYISRLMVRMRLGGASNKNLNNIIKANKEVLDAWKRNDLKVPTFLLPIKIFKRLTQFF